MPLECDYKGIANYQKLCWRTCKEKGKDGAPLYEVAPTTYVIGIMMMVIGLSNITPANWGEVWWRLRCYEAVAGAMRHRTSKRGKDVYLTSADVQKHIGLKTNAGFRHTRSSFVKMLSKVALDKALQRAGLDKE